jgi:hypothetical protein
MHQIEPPGELTDFNDTMREGWSRMMSDFIDLNIEQFNLPQFFNPTRTAIGADAAEKKIDWTAFPKVVELGSGGSDLLRWRTADRDRLRHQDEYCEWHVTRNTEGKVTKVEFTSEGPEYWSFLAEQSPGTVVGLYRQFVDPSVELEDLLDAGGNYIPDNRWNDPRRGGKLAHLAHRNNTLGAFVNIGARSTIIRHRADGTIMTGETELIDCGQYGGRDRHSDPHIGGEVNALARMDAQITMANPVGLSMDGLFPLGWETPDGSDPKDYWHVDRGSEKHQMRTRYEVPPDKGFVVGDIRINNRPIEFGGQIADFIRVKLVGLAHEFGQHAQASRDCVGAVSALAAMAAPSNVESMVPKNTMFTAANLTRD